MWRIVPASLGLALASALVAPARADPEPAEAIHAGVSIGVGTSYDLAGGRIELGSNHLSGFFGYGLLGAAGLKDTLSAPGGGGFCVGARWYRHVRRGLFVSLNFTYAWWSDYYSFDETSTSRPRTYPGNLFTATAVLGYRWRTEFGLVFEAGVGGGAYRHQEPLTTSAASPPPPGPAPRPTYGPIPDISLGIGFEL